MKGKFKGKALSFLVVFLLMVLVIGSSGMATSTHTVIPKLTTWSTYDVGSYGYIMGGLISEAITKKYGTRVRLVPIADDLSRLMLVNTRVGDIMMVSGSFLTFAIEGVQQFGNLGWGPQPLRSLRFPQHGGYPLAVRGDSKIYKASDLKGKRLPRFPGSPTTQVACDTTLAFAGLTWNDVIPVDMSSYTAGIKACMDGKVDAAPLNPGAGVAYEWQGMPYGLRYIERPKADIAGWKRIQKVMPCLIPATLTLGAGLSKEHPAELGTYPYPVFVAYDWSDEDLMYFLTKALDETYEMYAPQSEPLAAFFTTEIHWKFFDNLQFPLHKGAIRYYKELGQWSAEREARQQEGIKHQAELRALWNKAVDLAVEKKIREKDFPNFWLKTKEAAGFWAQ